jgi:hypothetical protein
MKISGREAGPLRADCGSTDGWIRQVCQGLPNLVLSAADGPGRQKRAARSADQWNSFS